MRFLCCTYEKQYAYTYHDISEYVADKVCFSNKYIIAYYVYVQYIY